MDAFHDYQSRASIGLMDEERLAQLLERIERAERQTIVATRALEHVCQTGANSAMAQRALLAQIQIVQVMYSHYDRLVHTIRQRPILTI